jgi:hypothetical protein
MMQELEARRRKARQDEERYSSGSKGGGLASQASSYHGSTCWLKELK